MQSINVFFALLLLFTRFSLGVGWIDCPSNGVRVCPANTQPLTISVATMLQNCVYQNCPQIILTAGSLTVKNVTFYSNAPNADSGGGAIRMVGDASTMLSISGSKFISCSATANSEGGGAIFILGPFNSQITISDTVFSNNTVPLGTGGAVRVSNSVNIAFRNINFYGNEAHLGGAIAFDSNINLALYNCSSSYNYATRHGGFCYVTTGIQADVNWHNSVSDTSVRFTGFFFSDTNCNIRISNAVITDCRSDNGGVLYSWGPSTIRMTNITIIRSRIAPSWNEAAHIFGQGRSALFLTNVNVFDSIGSDLVMAWNGPVTWNMGHVKNFTGIILVAKLFGSQEYKVGVINNVLVEDSTFFQTSGVLTFSVPDNTISNFQVRNVNLLDSASLLSMSNSATISNSTFYNISLQDGAIFSQHSGQGVSLEIAKGVVVSDVRIGGQGAIIFLQGQSNLTISASDLVVQNYVSAISAVPLFAHFMSDVSLIAGVSNLESSSIDPGTILVDSPMLASLILKTKFYNSFFPKSFKYTASIPSSLKIVNQANLTNLEILVATPLPSILVKPLNYFGDEIQFGTNTDNIVIIEIIEVSQNAATLTGETMKAVLDATTNEVEFSGLDIAGRKPGKYILAAHGVYGTLTPLPGKENDYPTVTLTVSDCDHNVEQFSSITGTCLPTYFVSETVRIILTAIAGVSAIIMALSLYALYVYRDYNAVKSNSYVFLSTMIVGSIIAVLSIVVQVVPSSIGCMAAAWLENTGFVISLSSITIKMYRLQKIFAKTLQSRVIRDDLKDNILIRNLFGFSAIILGYLGLWTGLLPALLVTRINSANTAIYVDICTSNEFDFVAITVRFLVTLIAAYYANLIRHVPSKFNETKLIGFSCYNWLFFGTLLNLLVEGYIEDPSTAFIIKSLSILFPHLCSAYFLVFIRVYRCRFKLDTQLNTLSASGTPYLSGSKKLVNGSNSQLEMRSADKNGSGLDIRSSAANIANSSANNMLEKKVNE